MMFTYFFKEPKETNLDISDILKTPTKLLKSQKNDHSVLKDQLLFSTLSHS